MEKNDLSGQPGKKNEYRAVLHRAADYCSRMERSSGQVRKKMKEWEVPDPWATKILDKLVEQKFVDDARYATLFAREKFRLNRWGRVKIAHALRQNGITIELIQEALEEIDEDTYYETCFELLKGKSATLKDKNQYIRKGKLLRYASARGFETDLIYRILREEGLG
jgi:regulatory protein